MSASGRNGGNGTIRPVVDTIDFVYDHGQEGDVAAHEEVKASDYTTIVGEHRTDTDEVLEVFKVELIPPTSNGTLETAQAIRLHDGKSFYPNLRYREFMMGYKSGSYPYSTPALGTPVLSGEANPATNVFDTAVPKFGTDTPVQPVWVNDHTPVTDSFRVRLWTVRWSGTDSELQEYLSQQYGTTSFQQNIGLSNPYKGSQSNYTRRNPIRIERSADGGALGQFTKLAGGVDQELPKVYPWVTWSENAKPTKPNKEYRFTTINDRVDEDWKRLEYDYTDRKEAALFESLQVNQPANLQEGVLSLDSRPDPQPRFQLTPNAAHQFPFLRPQDGSQPERDDVPVHLADTYEPQMVYDDGGGFRVVDDGDSIAADDLLVGVTGRKLELTS